MYQLELMMSMMGVHEWFSNASSLKSPFLKISLFLKGGNDIITTFMVSDL